MIRYYAQGLYDNDRVTHMAGEDAGFAVHCH